MKVTRESLKNTGFKPGKGIYKNQYCLKMNGHLFIVDFNEKSGTHRFSTETNLNSHHITHIDEIFGFIADDFYKLGKIDKTYEIQNVLGIQ